MCGLTQFRRGSGDRVDLIPGLRHPAELGQAREQHQVSIGDPFGVPERLGEAADLMSDLQPLRGVFRPPRCPEATDE